MDFFTSWTLSMLSGCDGVPNGPPTPEELPSACWAGWSPPVEAVPPGALPASEGDSDQPEQQEKYRHEPQPVESESEPKEEDEDQEHEKDDHQMGLPSHTRTG
jgi:hypothetical protein